MHRAVSWRARNSRGARKIDIPSIEATVPASSEYFPDTRSLRARCCKGATKPLTRGLGLDFEAQCRTLRPAFPYAGCSSGTDCCESRSSLGPDRGRKAQRRSARVEWHVSSFLKTPPLRESARRRKTRASGAQCRLKRSPETVPPHAGRDPAAGWLLRRRVSPARVAPQSPSPPCRSSR